MTIDDWEQIDSLSRMLRRMFGIGDDRATLLAKEHLLRSPRREMLEVARRYRELILTEAEQRRERERRNDPAPTPIGYLPPESCPIVITTGQDVPGCVKLAQERRAQ